jgi:CRP-like cAMP-binding protein
MYAQVSIVEDAPARSGVAQLIEFPAQSQRVLDLSPHQSLLMEGDKAGFVYEVLDGVVCCYRVLADGRRQVTSFAFPGDFIGIGPDDTYRFSCVATCATRVRSIPKSLLFRTADRDPNLGRRLLECAGAQMAGMLDHFVLLGRKSALEKVATFVLGLAKRNCDDEASSVTFTLPMTRADIADYLGTTNETVSRCLSKLRNLKVIDLPQPQVVVVHDIEMLENLGEAPDTAF